jgi:glycosyltransferase involved in cell wall biosynthesis
MNFVVDPTDPRDPAYILYGSFSANLGPVDCDTPTMRRANARSSDGAFFVKTPEDEKEKSTSYYTCKGLWIAVTLLILLCMIFSRIQENVFLLEALQDCLYDAEGYQKDLEDNENIINALEASLVLLGDRKQRQPSQPSLDYTSTTGSLPLRQYRIADMLQLSGSLSDKDVMSAFQHKWGVDSPLYAQCGRVSSRHWTGAAAAAVRPIEHITCKIAVLSSWSPRSCGIATYSSHLVQGLEARCPPGSKIDVVAVRNPNEPQGFYKKEPKVKFSFQKDIRNDYDLVAEFINSNKYDIVILSYEFGIFGDEYVMCLLNQIREEARVITVLHTVADNLPWQKQALTEQVVMLSHQTVVMTETMRRELDWLHRVPASLVQVVPHGVPHALSTDFNTNNRRSKESLLETKSFWGLDSDQVLFSNGLLHQGKGLEHVLAAMPAVLETYPEAKYVIQGAPHPTGEGTAEYYHMLKDTVRRLHLERNVFFDTEFLSDSLLLMKLQRSSIFINAYVDRVASVSGTLIMAMGSGVPCISTPYPFAREMLADQSGLLVPFADPGSIARAVVYLLGDPNEAAAIARRAQKKTHTWDAVASMFLEVAFNIL